MNPPDGFIAESVTTAGRCLLGADVNFYVQCAGAKTYIGPTPEHYRHVGEEEGEDVEQGERKAFEA